MCSLCKTLFLIWRRICLKWLSAIKNVFRTMTEFLEYHLSLLYIEKLVLIICGYCCFTQRYLHLKTLSIFKKMFNWRIIALQCTGFCPAKMWIRHKYSYILSLPNLLSIFFHSAPQVKTQVIRRLVHLIHLTAPIWVRHTPRGLSPGTEHCILIQILEYHPW